MAARCVILAGCCCLCGSAFRVITYGRVLEISLSSGRLLIYVRREIDFDVPHIGRHPFSSWRRLILKRFLVAILGIGPVDIREGVGRALATWALRAERVSEDINRGEGLSCSGVTSRR